MDEPTVAAESDEIPANGDAAPTPVTVATGWQVGPRAEPDNTPGQPVETTVDLASTDDDVAETVDEDSLDRAYERESNRRRERFLYSMVFLFGLAIVIPIASIGIRVAMTAPTYMAPLLIQPVIVLTSVWLGARLTRNR